MLDAPGAVIQGLCLDRQLAGGGDASVGTVVQQAFDRQMQRAVAGGLHTTADVEQFAGRQTQFASGR